MRIEVQPLKGRVFLKPEQYVPAETFLHIPESAKGRDMPERGVVFAIGGRRVTRKGVVIEHEFKVGDRVLFPRFVGLWVTVRGHRLIQIEAKDIAAILPK